MATTSIKGITIKIGGDTAGLTTALHKVNDELATTQADLKQVERLLKLDPTNTELLAQRQRLLAQAVEQSKDKIEQLKEAEKQAQEQLKKGKISQDQYEALRREIVRTEEALDSLQKEAKQANGALANVSAAATKIGSTADKIANKTKGITTAIAGLGAAAVATVPATEELRKDLSLLDQNAKQNGVGVDAAREAWEEFVVVAGEADSAVEATSNLLAAGFTESNLQKAVEGLAGAAQKFPDTLKIESLADSLQETLATGKATGQFAELLDRLGYSTEDFSAQLAACTSDAERQNAILELLANQGLNDAYNAWKKNNAAMVENERANLEWQQSTAEVAEMVLPVLTKVTQLGTKLLRWFTDMPKTGQVAIVTILALVASISPVAGMIANISTAVTTLTPLINTAIPIVKGVATGVAGVMSSIGAAATTLLNTVLPIIKGVAAAIAGWPLVIAAVILSVGLFGDQIQDVLQRVDDFLQNVFATDFTKIFGPVLGGVLNGFFAGLKDIWDAIKLLLDGVIDFIRGVFTGNWQRAWTGVKEIFASAFKGLDALVRPILNGIIALVNGVIGGLNTLIRGLNQVQFSVPSWVPGLGGKSFGINIPSISKIPYLAQGGVLLEGSAVVGEAGPELLTMSGGRAIVQPLTNSNTTHNSWGGINIAVYGAPGQDVRELADIIMEEIQSETERRGAVFG